MVGEGRTHVLMNPRRPSGLHGLLESSSQASGFSAYGNTHRLAHQACSSYLVREFKGKREHTMINRRDLRGFHSWACFAYSEVK